MVNGFSMNSLNSHKAEDVLYWDSAYNELKVGNSYDGEKDG